MSRDSMDRTDRTPTHGKNVALGAGVGMIFGAAFGNPGIGLVLGAALGLVVGGVLGRSREE